MLISTFVPFFKENGYSESDLEKLKKYVEEKLQRRKEFTGLSSLKYDLISDLSKAGVLECILSEFFEGDDYRPPITAVYSLTNKVGCSFDKEIEDRVRVSSADYISELGISVEDIDYYYRRVEDLIRERKTEQEKQKS